MKRLAIRHTPFALAMLIAIGGALLPVGEATAHSSSTSYLQLSAQGEALSGRWDIALRDLDAALDLDADGDGQLTWGEIKAAQPRIAELALSALTLSNDSACPLRVTALRIADHNDGRYAVLDLSGHCAAAPSSLTVDYRLLADLDRQHRGLLKLELGGQSYSAVLGPAHPRIVLGVTADHRGRATVFASYFREGLHHVWTGTDHLLFLAALFLPAVLWRTREGWRTAASLRPALIDTATMVTAFTLAHAVTLTLAALGWVNWPTRWVESAVAATVIFAALNNLVPMVRRGLAWLAAGFGLIHGSAIAGALMELGLPAGQRVWALLAFNLGVELAQLTLVAVVVPLSFVLRHSVVYRRFVLLPGSLLIALIGLHWLLQRAVGIDLLARFIGA